MRSGKRRAMRKQPEHAASVDEYNVPAALEATTGNLCHHALEGLAGVYRVQHQAFHATELGYELVDALIGDAIALAHIPVQDPGYQVHCRHIWIVTTPV